MNLDDANKQVSKLDTLLTNWTAVFKRHWYWILLIGFAGFVYWGSTLEVEEEEVPADPYYNDEYYEGYSYEEDSFPEEQDVY